MQTMNKKAQFGEFAIPIIIGVVALVAILFFGTIFFASVLFSTKFILNAAAFVIIIFAFMYAVRPAMQGEFTGKKAVFILILFAIAGILFMVADTSLFQQNEIGGSSVVYVPQYGNLMCGVADPNSFLAEGVALTQAKTFTCGVDMKGYTNHCDFDVRVNPESWAANNLGGIICSGTPAFDLYKCDNNNNCQQLSGQVTTTGYQQVYSADLDVNHDHYINTQDAGAFSSLKVIPHQGAICKFAIDVQVRGPIYYLYDTAGNNYKTAYEQGCNLLDIAGIHATSATGFNYQMSANQIPFGNVVNYVWGMVPVITSNVITHNGQQVYIEKAGWYDPIATTSDGIKYADWHNAVPDATIKCVPSDLFLCNADATLRTNPSTNLDGQSCSILRGVNPGDFFRYSETQCARYTCTNGLIVTSEKQNCAICGQGYQNDITTNTCVKVGNTGTGQIGKAECDAKAKASPWLGYTWVETSNNPGFWASLFGAKPTTSGYCKPAFFLYYIFGVIGIILVLGILYLLKPDKKKKKVRR